MRRNKSLGRQLAWRLTVLQGLIVLGLILGVTYSIYNAHATYVDEDVTHTLLRAVHRGDAGSLQLADTPELALLREQAPSLWFVISDELGHSLAEGEVPAALVPLRASLPVLEASELHDSLSPYTLTMRISAEDTRYGRLHVMVGGITSSGSLAMLLKVASYLGWRVMLPLVLITLVIMPWLVRRAMAGVAEVAAQASAIDIDERGARLDDAAVARELQPLVRAFNAALERLNEGYDARDRFLAGAAHELRAPIAILEARVEALAVGPARTRLLADVARLGNLAEQLLDLQRIDRPLSRLEPVDLVALAQEVTADVAPLVIDAGYELALDAADAPVYVFGDRLALTRVLTNLIQNAVAHGGGKGLVRVQVRADGSLAVADQGAGIPLQERARIFEPFYRVTPSSQGTGLGLHLVREIVTRHGGRVEVGDARGGGAMFRVALKVLG